MKLFQSLLVAPIALGFLSPLASNSAELNLNDLKSYSEKDVGNFSSFSEIYPSDWAYQAIRDVLSSRGCSNSFSSNPISRFEAASIINLCLKDYVQITNQERRLIDEFKSELAEIAFRVDGLEGSSKDFEAGSFSSTTVASFSADFAIGAVDGNATTEKTTFDYGYEVALTTSFTGEDSLDIALVAGVGQLSEFDLNQDDGNKLVVDAISYTLPLGDKVTTFVSNGVEGSSLFNTACVYSGPSDTLSSCGAVSSAIDEDVSIGAGASYDFGNGLTASIGYEGQGDTTSGLGSKEGLDSVAGQLAYVKDSYGFSVTFAEIEASDSNDDQFTAVNAFYSPEESGFPSISVGYEWGDDGSEATTADETKSYFIGLQWDELGDGVFGVAAGTHTPVIEDGDELLMYEVYYSYPINDGMTITPLVYTKNHASGTKDETGLMVKTSFSF
tara:strand:- start:355 stop:1683 length:1329 start_codon:yes stop_codon:yes gene_type:complete